MRCYTANEEVRLGILPEIRGGKTGVHFIDQAGGGLVLPMNQAWLERCYALDQKVLNTKLIIEGCSLGLPLIVSAELTDDGTELIGRPLQHQHSTQALVLIEPPFNERRVQYTSVAFSEVSEEGGRIGRTYKDIEEAVGVEVLIRHNDRLLVVMASGAMFRTQYVADDGSTRSLLFQWRDYAKPHPELVLVNQQRKSRAAVTAMLSELVQ